MATYTSKYTVPTAYLSVPHHGLAENLKVMSATVAVPSTLATTDVISFFTMPKNAKLSSFKIGSDQLDSNGAPTLALNVGDALLATRLFSAVAAGRTAGGSFVNETTAGAQYAGVGYQFPADTLIVASPTTASATGAAGNVTLYVFYTLEGGAS